MFRIAIINDFKNSFAYLEYRVYGELKIFNASLTKGEHRGYQIEKDSIGIFFNYELMFETKHKETAIRYIADLLEDAPCNDFRIHEGTLYDAL